MDDVDVRKRGQYHIFRDDGGVPVPEELAREVFPWVDGLVASIESGALQPEQPGTTKGFLEALLWGRQCVISVRAV